MSTVCRFYSPYFGDGCQRGINCKYIHHKSADYVIYCQKVNSEKPLDINAINNYNHHIEHYNNDNYEKVI